MKKVTIELNKDQQKAFKEGTGHDIDSLVVEQLEDRDAPSLLGVRDKSQIIQFVRTPFRVLGEDPRRGGV
jgi:hypothetical protein